MQESRHEGLLWLVFVVFECFLWSGLPWLDAVLQIAGSSKHFSLIAAIYPTVTAAPVEEHEGGQPCIFGATILPAFAHSAHNMAGKSLAALQRRIAALKCLQCRLKWPPLTEFQAFGQTYSLPCHNTSTADTDVAGPLLRYLTGFFDGDGCVSTNAKGSPQLLVGQSHVKAEILILFKTAFGGGIYAHVPGRGLRRPSLQWSLTGKAVKDAARRLAQHSVVKRGQLLLTESWPEHKQQRRAAAKQLSALKLQQSDPSFVCSWAYIAGFFDAEGCIRVMPAQPYITVSVSQKDTGVLSWIDNFWRDDLDLTSGSHLRKDGVTELIIGAQRNVHLVLRRLLAHGLLGKRLQAILALSLGSIPYGDIRSSMHKMSGNQGRYQHLTEAGCQRSKAIALLRDMLRHRLSAGKLEEAELLQRQLELMQQEHKLLNTLAVYNALRCDIRSLLSQGAVVC